MKKILILLIMVPVFAFAQQHVPNFPIDSATGRIQYQQKFDFPGDDKRKIFDVMMKWFVTNGGPNNPAIYGEENNGTLLSALLTASADGKYDMTTPDGYTNSFMLRLTVADGQAVITLYRFEVNFQGVKESLETYRDWVAQNKQTADPAKALASGNNRFGKQVAEEYHRNLQWGLLNNIDQVANEILRDARKYVKKAQKKQLI